MTVFNNSPAKKSSKVSWKHLSVVTAAFLLVAVAAGGNASAAVHCGATPAHHAASIQCRAHPLRAGVQGTQATIQAETAAANASDGAELTPISSTASAPKAFSAALAQSAAPAISLPVAPSPRVGAALSNTVGRAASAAGASAVRLRLDRVPVAASVSDVHASLGDLLGDVAAMPILSAPAAWSILLCGLLGLAVMARGPAVARAQSWATELPSRWAARSGTRAGAIDRVDPTRYARAQDSRSHQGHFVRAAARTRFGAEF